MRYDVHYCSAAAMVTAGKMPGDDISSMAEFDEYYLYVGTFEAADLAELSEALQSGGGGLGDETMQEFVMRRVQHTSMSLGDVAIERETGRVWFLALWGWKQIEVR